MTDLAKVKRAMSILDLEANFENQTTMGELEMLYKPVTQRIGELGQAVKKFEPRAKVETVDHGTQKEPRPENTQPQNDDDLNPPELVDEAEIEGVDAGTEFEPEEQGADVGEESKEIDEPPPDYGEQGGFEMYKKYKSADDMLKKLNDPNFKVPTSGYAANWLDTSSKKNLERELKFAREFVLRRAEGKNPKSIKPVSSAVEENVFQDALKERFPDRVPGKKIKKKTSLGPPSHDLSQTGTGLNVKKLTKKGFEKILKRINVLDGAIRSGNNNEKLKTELLRHANYLLSFLPRI